MSKHSIDDHFSQLENLCSATEFRSLLNILKNLSELMKTDNIRSELNEGHWKSISSIASIVDKIISKNSCEDDDLQLLAEFFRFLRNSCAGSVQNQQFILGSNEIFGCAKRVFDSFKLSKSEKDVIVLKCCLQLFGNLVCMGDNAKPIVWDIVSNHNVYKSLCQNNNYAVKEYTMMILYNCMCEDVLKYLVETEEGHEILMSVTGMLCDDLIDWGILFLEAILKEDNFMNNCYNSLPIRSRLLILDIITEQLASGHENNYFLVPHSSVNYLKNIFVEYVLNIVQICNPGVSDMKPLEIIKLLSLLCAASVSDSYNNILKSRQDLLETSLDTLKSVHLLGKSSTNAFSCISNLKVTSNITKEEIESNPSYGFKKNLIRLIGNLCYNCRENQDLVRKLDGIPLLLDCCNIDARNPFIMQWCILAIRNIMENNPENQAFLAGISITGDLVNSALIKELGFEVQDQNGKFVLKSLPSQT